MELISQHNHTNFTGHGEAEIEALIAHAHDLGMTNIAMTEHYPLSRAVDPTNYISMPWERLDEYCSRVLAQRKKYPDMDILLGCELDWLGDDEDRELTAEMFSDFDIVLGSVHYLDLWPFDDPAQRGHWSEVGADAIWDRYFEVWCQAVTSKGFFNVMSHPDLVKKFDIYPSKPLAHYYAMAAEAITETDCMIEVNVSGSYYACKDIFPNIELLREFKRAGVLCTIGSDAHKVEDVNRGLLAGYRHLYEAGYRELTVLLPGGDRKQIPLS